MNPPANTGDVSSIPGPGRFPHALEQLSLFATTIEPVLQSPGAKTTDPLCPRACAPTREATAVSSLHTATREWLSQATTREKPVQQLTPYTAKV